VRDAREALTTAGYKPHEARLAVDAARSHVGPEGTLEQVLRAALRYAIRGGLDPFSWIPN
jgi:Holliday junction resolvasome RuvABC DNA-binding subunit